MCKIGMVSKLFLVFLVRKFMRNTVLHNSRLFVVLRRYKNGAGHVRKDSDNDNWVGWLVIGQYHPHGHSQANMKALTWNLKTDVACSTRVAPRTQVDNHPFHMKQHHAV